MSKIGDEDIGFSNEDRVIMLAVADNYDIINGKDEHSDLMRKFAEDNDMPDCEAKNILIEVTAIMYRVMKDWDLVKNEKIG